MVKQSCPSTALFTTQKQPEYYGNKCYVMSEMLLTRYDPSSISTSMHTSNLAASDLESIYGRRVRSSLREMLNRMSFTSQGYNILQRNLV